MSYSPTVYEKGDIVTAEKLNHIENALVDVNKQYVVLNFSQDRNTKEVTVINSITFAEAWDLMYNQNQLIFMRVIRTGEDTTTKLRHGSSQPSFQYGDITTDVISYMNNNNLKYNIFDGTWYVVNPSDILVPWQQRIEQ